VTGISTVSFLRIPFLQQLICDIAIILYNRKTDYEKTKHLVHDMVKRAIELEGTATGEHGVGLVKRDYLPHELGESTVDAMRQLKKAFDPLCLLNCDKIVRATRPKAGEVAEW
jgi:D-lactate dehydrogenase (cytochrome)